MTKNQIFQEMALSGSQTPGASKGFVYSLYAIYTDLENKMTEDGIKWQIKAIEIDVLSVSRDIFSYSALLVQTAGTITNQTNLSTRRISEMLDTAINDDFGYEVIGKNKTGFYNGIVLDPTLGAASQTTLCKVSFRINFNKRLLSLFNKELSTERLQDLTIVLVGVGINAIAISHYYAVRVLYDEVAKDIVIR